MQQVLIDIATNPAMAAAANMASPEVAAKVRKLIDAGVIKTSAADVLPPIAPSMREYF